MTLNWINNDLAFCNVVISLSFHLLQNLLPGVLITPWFLCKWDSSFCSTATFFSPEDQMQQRLYSSHPSKVFGIASQCCSPLPKLLPALDLHDPPVSGFALHPMMAFCFLLLFVSSEWHNSSRLFFSLCCPQSRSCLSSQLNKAGKSIHPSIRPSIYSFTHCSFVEYLLCNGPCSIARSKVNRWLFSWSLYSGGRDRANQQATNQFIMEPQSISTRSIKLINFHVRNLKYLLDSKI